MIDIDKKLMDVMRLKRGNLVAKMGRLDAKMSEEIVTTTPYRNHVQLKFGVEWSANCLCEDCPQSVDEMKKMMIKTIKNDMYRDVINALIGVQLSLLVLPCDAQKEISMIQELIDDLK